MFGYPKENYPYIEDEEREELEERLISSKMVKSLGKGFELGGHFVPISGDGNCFFTAVSTYLSCSEVNPFGTVANHASLRTKTCNYIKNNSQKEPFNKIKNLNAYLSKKSIGDGSMGCWSDWYTMCGMSFSLKRPIK